MNSDDLAIQEVELERDIVYPLRVRRAVKVPLACDAHRRVFARCKAGDASADGCVVALSIDSPVLTPPSCTHCTSFAAAWLTGAARGR